MKAGENDRAWEWLFEKHRILEHIEQNGCFFIEAKTIRGVREPRLMAKFDHRSNLPEIFKKNRLAILPVSRSRYCIGPFDAYHAVKYREQKPTPIPFPAYIRTIDPANLYSESAALHCAFAAGMMDQILGETTRFTVSGRMSSQHFQMHIRTYDGGEQTLHVSNAQVEIDGGYEGAGGLLIVEAKNEKVDDFLVRQLYYPYRLWKGKLDKPVFPVFLTYSNDVFTFFVYEFSDPSRYHSLSLAGQYDFIIAHDAITVRDLADLPSRTPILPEPEIPFPQADKFTRVVDLLGLLVNQDLSKEDITLNYNFDMRQTHYYTDAARYLGLAEKYTDADGTIRFRLTENGQKVMKLPYKPKYLALAGAILSHSVFRNVFEWWRQNGYPPDRAQVVEMMKTAGLFGIRAESTYYRRAQTVLQWVRWILALTD